MAREVIILINENIQKITEMTNLTKMTKMTYKNKMAKITNDGLSYVIKAFVS